MSNFSIETFRPYALQGDLKRYGNKSDGGYIINTKYLELSNVLYTYGVGGEVSFEIDLLKHNPNYKIHLYDPTISQFPEIDGNVIKHKEGLASYKQDKYDNLLNHLSINQDMNEKVLLKISILLISPSFPSKWPFSAFINSCSSLFPFLFAFCCWYIARALPSK